VLLWCSWTLFTEAENFLRRRWLFIIEGSITIAIAFAAFFVLPNFPRTTTWLTEQDANLPYGVSKKTLAPMTGYPQNNNPPGTASASPSATQKHTC